MLCDRIAIMNQGEIKCCGKPSFLKENFGKGYHLTVYKRETFNEDIFKNIIELFDSNFTVETDTKSEMCVALPHVSDSDLAEMLKSIEENKFYIGIENYAIGSATIEEVFLK